MELGRVDVMVCWPRDVQCSELSRWSCPNGGNRMYSGTSGGTADQSYVSVTVVRDMAVASRS